MRFDDLETEGALLAELGLRIEAHRLGQGVTQSDLAERAGVGRATVQRVEGGDSVQLLSLVRILRALDLLGGLEDLVPAADDDPLAEWDRQHRRRGRRRRARSATEKSAAPTWHWGEESPPR